MSDIARTVIGRTRRTSPKRRGPRSPSMGPCLGSAQTQAVPHSADRPSGRRPAASRPRRVIVCSTIRAPRAARRRRTRYDPRCRSAALAQPWGDRPVATEVLAAAVGVATLVTVLIGGRRCSCSPPRTAPSGCTTTTSRAATAAALQDAVADVRPGGPPRRSPRTSRECAIPVHRASVLALCRHDATGNAMAVHFSVAATTRSGFRARSSGNAARSGAQPPVSV